MIRPLALLVVALAGCTANHRSLAPPMPVSLPAPNAPFPTASTSMRIAALPVPGEPAFVAIARDIVDVVVSLDPSVAASAGLFDDAVRVPSYDPDVVSALVARIDRDLAGLRALPWRSYPVDQQIDYCWLWASAKTARHQLVDERLFEHRPAQWLESLGNTLIAFLGYAPDRPELGRRTLALVPRMLNEVKSVVKRSTRRDVVTAAKVTDALITMANQTASPEGRAAATALVAYANYLKTLQPSAEFEVIGAASYAWRYRHGALLPWTPAELHDHAQNALATIDAELATLEPKLGPTPDPTPDQRSRARTLTRESLLGLYDGIEVTLREATRKGGWVSIPDAVGPVRARETPDAMVPLTGDGGSMNPPPTYVSSNVSFWNVEHFQPTWSEDERLKKVTEAQGFLDSPLGPYAAHEGFPGHHLQLSIARLHKDPIRSILPDPVENEGWALYVEQVLWDHGGYGDSARARRAVLGMFRLRASRVVYDVNIETGIWDLQHAADFKGQARPGQGKVDEDILRAIQWPTQLICYFAGRLQILALRDEMKRKLGSGFDDRAFHDALLAEGSIPIALTRAKMLHEPMPAPEE